MSRAPLRSERMVCPKRLSHRMRANVRVLVMAPAALHCPFPIVTSVGQGSYLTLTGGIWKMHHGVWEFCKQFSQTCTSGVRSYTIITLKESYKVLTHFIIV